MVITNIRINSGTYCSDRALEHTANHVFFAWDHAPVLRNESIFDSDKVFHPFSPI